MKDTELKKERDRALYEVYKKGLNEGAFHSLREAAAYVCSQPAPQFFIDAKRASIYIGMLMVGIQPNSLNACSKRRIKELFRRYKKWREDNQESTLTRERVCEILVSEPAPEFYLSEESARIYIQKLSRKTKEEMCERLVSR